MITVEDEDGVARVWLSHGKANLLDLEFCETFAERLDELADEAAVVLTATGSIFSAGVDLVQIAEGGAKYVRAFLPAMRRLFERLLGFPRPLVVAMNGHAIAGGAVIVASADRRIGARAAGRLGVPELRVGVPFPIVALEIVRRVVRPDRLDEVVLGASTDDPEWAQAVGLLDEVVDDPASLLPRAVAVASDLGGLRRGAFETTKAALRAPSFERLRAGAALDREVAAAWEKPETIAAIRDYVERTLRSEGGSRR